METKSWKPLKKVAYGLLCLLLLLSLFSIPGAAKKGLHIDWNKPADIFVGTPLGPTQLNARAIDNVTGHDVPGKFFYNPKAGTILTEGTYPLYVDFKPDSDEYPRASAGVTINVLPKRTPDIIWYNWGNPNPIFNGTKLSKTQLNASAKDPVSLTTVRGTFDYTPLKGTVLSVGNHTLHVDFTPTDKIKYTTASKDITIDVVEKITPTITWNNPDPITYGTKLSSTQLNAIVNDPGTGDKVRGTLKYDPAAGKILPEGTHTLHVDFTPTDKITYTTASKDVTIKVVPKIIPTITWNNPDPITYGTKLSSTQLNAVVNDSGTKDKVRGTLKYDPAAGKILPEGTHTLHVDFTPTDKITYTTASKDVTIKVVPKTIPTINWDNPDPIIYGTKLSSTQLNAVATDPITQVTVHGKLIYNPAAGTVLKVGQHTLHVDFKPTDKITYTTAPKDVTINVVSK